jgi:hypothetical protein
VFYGAEPSALVAQACEHGALVHGFTPAYYTSERLASMSYAARRA